MLILTVLLEIAERRGVKMKFLRALYKSILFAWVDLADRINLGG